MRFQNTFLFLLLFVSGAFSQKTDAILPFQYSGRIETLAPGNVALISPASSVGFRFGGESCDLFLALDHSESYNYVSIELDGAYWGRLQINPNVKTYTVTASSDQKVHTLLLYKATEASVGGIIFQGAKADTLLPLLFQNRKKIEFIGDSLIAGMGVDAAENPCGNEIYWFDQHNAYWTYAAITVRELDLDCMMSAVSGMGMYRNWDTESEQELSMPFVYDNLYLNKDASKGYDASFKPDIICIALGYNDMVEKVGERPKNPFDAKTFTAVYKDFVRTIMERKPQAKIVLVSPFLDGEKETTMDQCLAIIKEAFAVTIFKFGPWQFKGCYDHPDIENHQQLAKVFVDFLNTIDY